MDFEAADDTGTRARRRDAAANRERILEGALRTFAREGLSVPLAAVAREAGVGIATFYRCFPDRQALMVELEHRAYDTLLAILDEIFRQKQEGLHAVQLYLDESVRYADRLILPLHGAPPLVDAVAVAKRQRIDGQLEVFLDQARAVSAIRDDVNATDIIICSALVTQPLRQGPNWAKSAARHVALFVAGLSSQGPLPATAIRQSDIEATFHEHGRARFDGQNEVDQSR